MKCKCCDAEVADDKDETLAAARWGWVMAPDPGLGIDHTGEPIPGWWYACPDCSDPDRRDAWADVRRMMEALKVGNEMHWRKVVSNYGHVSVYKVTIRKIGKRITVDVPQKGGGVRRAVVTRDRLHPIAAP